MRKYSEGCIRIPMIGDVRSLNLSNAVALLAYDVYRQNGFKGLKKYADNGVEENHEWKSSGDFFRVDRNW